MPDIYLYSVPSDADRDDVRLRDPTTIGGPAGPISGSASITEADDTLAATATLALSATASISEAGDALSSAAALAIVATSSQTEADDTVASTAVVAINATLAATEAADTLASASALAIAANANIAEADDATAAAATLLVSAVLAPTEDDDALAATATGPPAVSGGSGRRRLAASASWNIDRVQALLASVQMLLGRMDKVDDPGPAPLPDFIPAAKPIRAEWVASVQAQKEADRTAAQMQARKRELREVEARLQRVIEAQVYYKGFTETIDDLRRAGAQRTKALAREIEEDDEDLLLLASL
jgi:hypothetical protein